MPLYGRIPVLLSCILAAAPSGASFRIVHLDGLVNEQTVGAVHRHLATTAPPYYVYLDTPGGRVDSGISLMQAMLHTPNTTCIVRRAISMGFALLQTCTNRWVLPDAVLMQHMPRVLNASGTLPSVLHKTLDAYTDYRWMLRVQADRLGLDPDMLHNHVASVDEWWLTPEGALRHKCADRIVHEEPHSTGQAMAFRL